MALAWRLANPATIVDSDEGFEPFNGHGNDDGGGTPLGFGGDFVDNNGTLGGAQVIQRGDFGTAPDANVNNDKLPRVQIQGFINQQDDLDLYAVELVAGETIVLDVDFAWGQGDGMDPMIWLLDANGNVDRGKR